MVPLLEVRGAVQWPTAEAPGYYLIMARKAERDALGQSVLMFLAEGQAGLPPKDLYASFTDDISRGIKFS